MRGTLLVTVTELPILPPTRKVTIGLYLHGGLSQIVWQIYQNSLIRIDAGHEFSTDSRRSTPLLSVGRAVCFPSATKEQVPSVHTGTFQLLLSSNFPSNFPWTTQHNTFSLTFLFSGPGCRLPKVFNPALPRVDMLTTGIWASREFFFPHGTETTFHCADYFCCVFQCQFQNVVTILSHHLFLSFFECCNFHCSLQYSLYREGITNYYLFSVSCRLKNDEDGRTSARRRQVT